MTDEQTADEKDDLLDQFLSDSDANAEDKQALVGLLNATSIKRLVGMLVDWCYDEGYDDGEAGRQ
ncbi:hypothetical protein LCGC14_0799780 [marine sediment metagenome]|uniref:Uncharacterized protein n=1 Tax=marine sediment metagenome TaxID=412755 RepID=A0A0F9PUJ8_9ZZZZ